MARQPTDATRIPPSRGGRSETDSGHGAPDRKRLPTRLWLDEGVDDQGQRARHQPRGTNALRHSSRDEEGDGVGDGACCAGQDEHRQPDGKPVRTPVPSADEPARSSSEAKATVYPSTTHCAVDGAPPRSAPIARSATFTIVASSVIIKNPAEIAASASAWPFDLRGPASSEPSGDEQLHATRVQAKCPFGHDWLAHAARRGLTPAGVVFGAWS